jgi:hypothetical protein
MTTQWRIGVQQFMHDYTSPKHDMIASKFQVQIQWAVLVSPEIRANRKLGIRPKAGLKNLVRILNIMGTA